MCQGENRKERERPMLRLNCIWIYVIHKVCAHACACMCMRVLIPKELESLG